MSRDPIIDTAEQVAEKVFERETAGLEGRLDAHAGRLRENQVDAIDQAGLPADLVATETNVWRRLSPARNRWPEIAEFDQRVAELEARQAAKAEELRELRDREISAPAADADRLATWQLDGERGDRPEPELPTIREQIERRREEWEALTRATERVLQEKAEFVAKHRGRLVKDADSHADQAHRRYLERRDIDRRARVLTVRRTVSSGEVVELAKTTRSRRQVPLPARAIEALDALPPRLDSQLVFPAARGGVLNLDNWRRREWAPAIEASGVARPARIYDLRSTFASNALAAGVSVFELARIMGTSVAMIERHYGTLIEGAAADITRRLDAFDAKQARRLERDQEA
jgi:hypothetical protein